VTVDCANALDCLSQQLDDDLALEVQESLRAHLDNCAQCRAAAAELLTLHRRLRALVPDPAMAERIAVNAVRTIGIVDRAGQPGGEWRRSSVLLAAITALAACVYAVLWLPGVRPADITSQRADQVKITLARGSVDVRPPSASDWRMVSLPEDALQQVGCRVRTAQSSQCEVVCPSGGVVRLDEQTELTFSRPSELAVAHGRVWCEAPARESLTVVASFTSLPSKSLPVFTCSPASAMQTTVSKAESIEVYAASGPIHVVSDATPVTLSAGHRIAMSADGLKMSEPVETQQQMTWMLPLLALRGGADREFSSGVTSLLARIGGSKLDHIREQELIELGGPGAVPLIAYLKTSTTPADLRKRHIAARVIQETAAADSVADLIDLLESSEPEVRFAAAKALLRLTGLDQGVPPAEWSQWGTRQQAAVAEWRNWLKAR
jgi:hypothetical protein